MKLLSKLFNLNDLKRGTWLIKLSAYISILSSTVFLVILSIVSAFVINKGLSITLAVFAAIILIATVTLVILWIYSKSQDRPKILKWKQP